MKSAPTMVVAFGIASGLAIPAMRSQRSREHIRQDYSGPAWSPYLVGALIGGLSMLTFYFSNKPLGASTAYARVAGMLGLLVAPKHTKSLEVLSGE